MEGSETRDHDTVEPSDFMELNFSKKYKQFWLSSNFMYSRSLNYQWDLDDTATPYYSPGNDVNNFHMTLKLAYLIPLATKDLKTSKY